MDGILLNARTGRPEGRASCARLNEEDFFTERERDLARVAELLEKSKQYPEIQATTTTRRYLSYPAAATGISRASSGSTAWSFSAYTEVVPVNTITSQYYLAGFTWAWHTPAAAADTTYQVLFELATGAAASEVLIAQIPGSFRADTLVGYVPSNFVVFPEPKEVAANTRISVRVAQSLATTSQTYSGIKILYSMV